MNSVQPLLQTHLRIGKYSMLGRTHNAAIKGAVYRVQPQASLIALLCFFKIDGYAFHIVV